MRKRNLTGALVWLTVIFAWAIVTPAGGTSIDAAAAAVPQDMRACSDDGAREKDPTRQQGWTPLHEAAASGDVRAVSLLIDQGAKVNAKTTDGVLPIHVAIRRGHVDVVRVLIAKGADVLAKDRTRLGDAPLHYAARFGQPELARLLVRAGARVDEESRRGDSPIAIAMREGHPAVVRVLSELGSKYPRYLFSQWLDASELQAAYRTAECSGTRADLLSFVATYAGRTIFARPARLSGVFSTTREDQQIPENDLVLLLKNAALARVAAIEIERAGSKGLRLSLQSRLQGLDEQQAGVSMIDRRLREAGVAVMRGDDTAAEARFVIDLTWSNLVDRYYGQPCGDFFRRPCQGGQLIATGGRLRGAIQLTMPSWEFVLPIDYTASPPSSVRAPGPKQSELTQDVLDASGYTERLAHMIDALTAPRLFAERVSTHYKERWDFLSRPDYFLAFTRRPSPDTKRQPVERFLVTVTYHPAGV